MATKSRKFDLELRDIAITQRVIFTNRGSRNIFNSIEQGKTEMNPSQQIIGGYHYLWRLKTYEETKRWIQRELGGEEVARDP